MRSIANFIPQFIKNVSLGRFVVAVALAVMVWGYVIVTQYPELTLPPQEVTLGEPIPPPADLEVVPSESQVNSSVRIILSGPSDTVKAVTISQIQPYLDLSQCRVGTCLPKVQLKQPLPQYVNWKADPATVPVVLEARASKTLPVEVIRGSDVNPDYTLEGDLTASPTEVTVTGRQSLIDRIAKAQVTVNLTGRVGAFRLAQSVGLVDTRGQAIPDTSLTITPSTINVTGNIVYKLTSRTVPIRVVTTGEPAAGYIAGTAQATPLLATVVSGNLDTLNKLEYVSTQPVNISGASSEVSTTVKLEPIPDITFTGGDSVQVGIGIVPFQTSKTISVRLELVNSASNLRYNYDPTVVNLTISGPYTAFQPELPLDQIKATVNVQDRGVGTYTMPVQVELPPNLVVTNNPTVKVTIFVPATPTPLPTLAPIPTPTRTVAPTPLPTATPHPSATAGTGTNPTAPTTPGPTTAPSTAGTAQKAAGTPSPAATTVAQAATAAPSVAVMPEKIAASPPSSPSVATDSPAVASTTPAAQTAQPQSNTPKPSLQVISREPRPTPTPTGVELLIYSPPEPAENALPARYNRNNQLL
jgi:YbbR domain-containing protein